MKFNSVKRLLAMLLVLCMVVPMLPASWFTQTKAAGTVDVYFKNSVDWGNVYGYAWQGDTLLTGAWPGTKLTADENGLYKLTVPTGNGFGVIFNDNYGGQTPDISVTNEMASNGNSYWVSWDNAKCDIWTYQLPIVKNGVVTFTYEDSKASNVYVAGTFNNWSASDAKMTKSGSEFTYTCTMPAGDYEYKFVVDGQWYVDPWNPIVNIDSGGTYNNCLTVPAYTESNSVKVIAGSDYQDANAADTVKSLLSAIKRDGYPTVDGFLFAGDYSTETSSASDVNALKNAVNSVYPGLGTSDRGIYVQGNHDPDSMLSTTLSSFGAHDTGSYGVFVINEQNYMWYNNDEATVKSTAAALRSYLDQKLDQAYNKPIFVVSHLPLHYSMRTKNDGDGQYANYLFDVLNTAAASGLNIFFLYGHDHSNGWDDYLGGSAVYLKKGDSINIAQASKTAFKAETLNFTYLNAGYVGYYNNCNTGAETDLTMTLFEISDSEVKISRYSAQGLHQLKSPGVTNSYLQGRNRICAQYCFL